MRMVKIIFSDFDNTLMDYYSDRNHFDDYQINVLKKLQDKGIKFSIVTGRSVNFFEQFPNLLLVLDYIVGSNGACIYDVKNKEFIYQRNIKYEVLNKLLYNFIDNNFSFILNCLDKRYKYGDFSNIKALDYKENESYNCEQLVLFCKKKYSDDVVKFVEYFDNVIVNNVSSYGDEYTFDVNDKCVSKGNSIKWLCEELNINSDESICFGDGVNDISMFDVVGKSIAMGNSSDSVKTQANEVALSCYENGVYKYIEDNILK